MATPIPDRRTRLAVEILERFAERTGVVSDRPPRRYLWTDAFAVCTLLGLEQTVCGGHSTTLAVRLVDRVHRVLGRHRPDDPRVGWISGLDERAGEEHPTQGGLRIGKPLPERRPDEPFDERLEWERDGQYFHYLTKWMHALDQTSRATGEPRYNAWARDLARAAHRAFVYATRGGRRMHWKMSIDLSRPLVASMGHHDPLDGFVTCMQLAVTHGEADPGLEEAAADFAAMLEPRELGTSDPLGLGGLLVDAYRLHQIIRGGGFERGEALREVLLAAALFGLHSFSEQTDLRSPASQRLAFRELGLAVGLAAASRLADDAQSLGAEGRATLDRLERFAPLRPEIEAFWLDPEHRKNPTWLEHADINDVTLATSLRPEGFLVLRPR